VLAEVIELEVGVEQHPRRLGEHDLAAVRRTGDSGRAVHVDPDVALVGDDRLAGVDADAYLHRTRPEREPGLLRRGDGVRRSAQRGDGSCHRSAG